MRFHGRRRSGEFGVTRGKPAGKPCALSQTFRQKALGIAGVRVRGPFSMEFLAFTGTGRGSLPWLAVAVNRVRNISYASRVSSRGTSLGMLYSYRECLLNLTASLSFILILEVRRSQIGASTPAISRLDPPRREFGEPMDYRCH